MTFHLFSGQLANEYPGLQVHNGYPGAPQDQENSMMPKMPHLYPALAPILPLEPQACAQRQQIFNITINGNVTNGNVTNGNVMSGKIVNKSQIWSPNSKAQVQREWSEFFKSPEFAGWDRVDNFVDGRVIDEWDEWLAGKDFSQ